MIPSPAAACAILAADYAGDAGLDVVERYDYDGVQLACVQVDGILGAVWRGTAEPTRRGLALEWLRRNLDVFPYRAIGDHATWTKGTFGYALVGTAFFKGRGIRWQLGHSLGAGAAAIALCQLLVPTIIFAPPRVLYAWQAGDEDLSDVRSLLTIYASHQDWVPHLPICEPLPPFRRAKHVKEPIWLEDPDGPAWTPAEAAKGHSISRYAQLISGARVEAKEAA